MAAKTETLEQFLLGNDEAREFILNIENVKRAYNGKTGCMCGCNGNYKTMHPELARCSNDEVSKASVSRRFNKVLNSEHAIVLTTNTNEYIVYLDYNERSTVLYY